MSHMTSLLLRRLTTGGYPPYEQARLRACQACVAPAVLPTSTTAALH